MRHARRRRSRAIAPFISCSKTACRRCGKWPGYWSAKANLARRAPNLRADDSAILKSYSDANVAELVDAPDLGSGGETRASSSLAFRTKHWPPLLTNRA